MGKKLVVFVGIFIITACVLLASKPGTSRIVFTLTNPDAGSLSGGRLGISFSLALGSGGPTAFAGGEIIEDQGYPRNTAIGCMALFDNTTGHDNTASGYQALINNTEGRWNTANGVQALFTNTSGYSDTAMGYQALYSNISGICHTAIGYQALYSNTTGGWNTANGYNALYRNTTGSANTAVGRDALWGNTTGFGNTVIGCAALEENSTGSFNVAIGIFAGGKSKGNHNIFLGGCDPDFPTTDTNTIRIGYPYDSSEDPPIGQNQTFIAGIVEKPFMASDYPSVVGITSDGQLGTMSSDLLPPGPQGPAGLIGPPGPAGEGLIPGSLLFLMPEVTPPSGYELVGIFELTYKTTDKKSEKLDVSVYKKL